MHMLAWAFAARICDLCQTFINWSINFGLSLNLHPIFFNAISEVPCETARMCRLIWSFAASIGNTYINHMNWYKQFGLSLNLHLLFLMKPAKALARQRECAKRS